MRTGYAYSLSALLLQQRCFWSMARESIFQCGGPAFFHDSLLSSFLVPNSFDPLFAWFWVIITMIQVKPFSLKRSSWKRTNVYFTIIYYLLSYWFFYTCPKQKAFKITVWFSVFSVAEILEVEHVCLLLTSTKWSAKVPVLLWDI